MEKITREQKDAWATDTLKQLILSTHAALGERPPEIPGYLESEIISNGIRAKIRVDFSEDHGAVNGTQIKRPVSLESWNAMNKEWNRDGIKLVAGFWAAMLILGGLLYWLLVIIG